MVEKCNPLETPRKGSCQSWKLLLLGYAITTLAIPAMAHAQAREVRGSIVTTRPSRGEESNTIPGANAVAQLPGNMPPLPPNLPFGQAKPEQVPAPKIEAGPLPRPAGDIFGPNLPRMGRLDILGGTPPIPSKVDNDERLKYFDRFIDPKFTLDLVINRARLLKLNETPRRIQLADENIALYNLITNKEITILGKTVGTTVMNFWFGEEGKEVVISYLVRVFPDPEAKDRLERIYKALEMEINKSFPDSIVHLRLVGDKVLVTGQARDSLEAANILKLLVAANPASQFRNAPIDSIQARARPEDNALIPGTDNYLLPSATNIINMMRIPGEQQINLRCTVAHVNRTAARSIGLNFKINSNNGNSFQNLTGSSALSANLPFVLAGGNVTFQLMALKNLGYAREIAEPNLTTMNGKPANFRSGGQFPVPVAAAGGGGAVQGTQFVPFGVSMNFTPFITDKDRIRMLVQGTFSATNGGGGAATIGGGGGTVVPGLVDQTFSTTVELREGQTFAVAGLIQNTLNSTTNQLPFLGDIPFLRNFTGTNNIQAGEEELVILVTPELVHPMEQKLVPPLPGSDIFEPSDCEFYLLGRVESRRHYDFRSPVMNDCERIKSYQRCEQTYIFGPTGYNINNPNIQGTIVPAP